MAGNRADRRVRTVQEKEKRLKKNRNESRSSSEGTRGRVRRQMHRRRVAPTRNHCRASGKMRSAIVCIWKDDRAGMFGNARGRAT